MSTQALEASRVEEIFVDCLYKDGESTDNNIRVDGIMLSVGLNPKRIDNHRSEIEAMLEELPDEFKASGGGGWSFLNACNDRHDRQWTGLHQRMDQLFMLGMAIGKVELQSPRELWQILPGGMPYFIIML